MENKTTTQLLLETSQAKLRMYEFDDLVRKFES